MRAVLTLCTLALCLLAFAPSAFAAPAHLPTPDLDVEGLNHACGAAVDSEGNVYASSAGEGKIKVYAPGDHDTPIAEIANANEPCGLAVNSKGILLVSERATGNVVAYGPDAFPLSGTPTFSPAATIDAGGDAEGIAIDRSDDRLFVAEGDHVAVYRSEAQQVSVSGATGGTYKLKFEGQETAPIPFNATAAEVKAALEALSTIGPGEISISNSKRVTFVGTLGYTDVAQLEAISSLQGNEIQKVTVNATTGTYKLKFEGEETAAIAFNAPASAPGGPVDSVQEALEALANIAPGDVSVVGGPGDTGGTKPYLVTFEGAYAATNVGTMSSIAGGLAGGSAAVASASQFQTLTVSATGGTYKLKFEGQETAPIPFNATAAELKAALEALANIAPGDVSVVGGPGDAEGTRPYLVHFEGAYATTDVPVMTRDVSALTGTASVSRITSGAGLGTSTPTSGGVGTGETQGVNVTNALSGTYKLKFGGEETAPIAFNAKASEPGGPVDSVQEALEALANIAPGDVSVFFNGTPTFASRSYAVGFGGAYAATDVPQIEAISSLGPGGAAVTASTTAAGWSGRALEGQLTEATGVAAYTNANSLVGNLRLNLAVAVGAGDEVELYSGPASATALKLRKTITGVDHDGNPGTAEQEFSFGAAGAYLAADPGNEDTPSKGCIQVQVGGLDQACTQGHLFLHDAGNDAIYEFDTTGELFAQITAAGLSEDGEPTQVAVERSGGANDGTLYVSTGKEAGAALLAFAPVLEPSRPPLIEPFSKVLSDARAVATDCEGYVYVAAQSSVRVYSPAGSEVTSFTEANAPLDLAVDCSGHVYVVDTTGTPQMTYYSPSSYPPTGATTYGRQAPSLLTAAGLQGVAVNPANDHVFVLGNSSFVPVIREFGPPSGGSTAVGECGSGLGLETGRLDIDVYGKNGNVYVSAGPERVYVLKCGTVPLDAELIREVKGGGGCPSGDWGGSPRIAVDQSNGHFIEYANNQPGAAAREHDAAGACLAEFGTFSFDSGGYRLAIDNSCALHDLTESTTPTCADTYPSNGIAYVAWDGPDDVVQPYDVSAFGPLGYGVPPKAVTGAADGFGPAGATLNGTVDPEEFELEECAFQYLTEVQYQSNGETFEGALSQPCEETPAEIGKGNKPVPVHAEISGIEPESTRYRYRLHAENPFGEDDGEAILFGPPLLTTQSALPVGYDEATMRAKVDPSGLLTTYRFEYLTEEEYEANGETFVGAQSTQGEIPPGDGEVAIEAPVTGLAQGTAYRFHILVENAAAAVEGDDPPRAFETLVRAPAQDCENSEYRVGLSAFLPDCRAYELVTPAQTLGEVSTFNATAGHRFFNSWFVEPRGPGAGESVAYRALLAGLDGLFFRAQRGPGAHPEGGWESEMHGFTFVQGAGDLEGEQGGVSADQLYWLHEVLAHEAPTELAFPLATYMRVPSGQASRDCAPEPEATFELADPDREFELVGCGDLGTDPQADGRYISAGGGHVIFTSDEHLDEDAPPAEAETEAIYDREAGSAATEVVSLKPDGTPFGSDARYIASTEDGEAVVFSVAGALYLHRGEQTTQVAAAPNTYAGISEDGERVFFIDATYTPTVPNPMVAAGLHACDVEGGNCAGPEQEQEPLEIAPNSVFVNVSADGSHVFFTSEEVLTGEEANENGEKAKVNEPNLYAWDGTDTRFVAPLHPQDLVSFSKGAGEEELGEDLLQWTNAIPGQSATSGPPYEIGRAASPTRSTPDGEVLVFQSHAQLTDYDNEEKGEIYRYAPAPAAVPGPQLSCISCSPSGAPHASPADALLQTVRGEATSPETLVPNVTDDGSAVFFESRDALLPEDANAGVDVYEWKALGTEGPGGDVCERPGGCLALISTGQSEESSYLFGMSADGEDVFFLTREVLAGADIAASFSFYDARVLGGIPDPPAPAPCEGDACQGQGSTPPVLPTPATTGAGNGNEKAGPRRCAKGKHRVKGRCVPKKHRKRSRKKQKAKHAKQRASHEGRAHR